MSKKISSVNNYSSAIYDIIRGIPVLKMSEEELAQSFMDHAKLRWYENALEQLGNLVERGDVVHNMNLSSKSNTILIDLPETTPSGNSQMLEIKVSIKVKE